MTTHNERCKDCKKRVYELLTKLFGEIKINYNLQLSNDLDSLKETPYYSDLKNIFTLLQNHRGHNKFIRAKKIPNVDFFVVNQNFIVEFDESQHFTEPRKITLTNYPSQLKLSFNKKTWIEHCEKLHKKDNDPPFRDEQRAWYDTIRDFAPSILNLKPTVRLYAKDCIWCKLDPENKGDVEIFKKLVFKK